MGAYTFNESSMPPISTPAFFMSKNYNPKGCKYLQKWQNITKNNPELQWPLWGTFQLDKIIHLRSALKSKSSPIKQTEQDTYFNWYAVASKGFKMPKELY